MTATVRHVHGVCPLDCPDTCSWVVTVENGQAVKLQGNRDHPYTRGALCMKVNRYLEHARLPDRLLWPMRRVGRKGEGRFARIGWAIRGLRDGDVARVHNDRGEYLAAVQVSDRVPPGIVGGAKGHWPKLNPGATSIAATVMEKDADMGRGAVFHDNRVEVERAAMTSDEFRRAFTALGGQQLRPGCERR